MSSQSTTLESSLLKLFSSILPPLLPSDSIKPNHIHKGVAGRILVIGGCNEYAGAPYFSALSAFRGVWLHLVLFYLNSYFSNPQS